MNDVARRVLLRRNPQGMPVADDFEVAEQTSEAILTGFRQSQWADRHEEAFAMLAMWVRSGRLKYREDIVVGLENAPRAFIGLLQGMNFGKLLIQAGEDPTRAA
ncbi:MAG: hypothetical protein OXP69_07325 [Spirochaetaceae bacterium]|nr:hypothetical protein [Spirochaetaceae bacterium]